jgi:hypothetical protein
MIRRAVAGDLELHVMASLFLYVVGLDKEISSGMTGDLDGLTVVTDGLLRISMGIDPVHEIFIAITDPHSRPKCNIVLVSGFQETDQLNFADGDSHGEDISEGNHHLV